MKQHEDNNYYSLYYLVALLTGLFIGVVTCSSILYTLGLGIGGLAFGGFFLATFVKGHGGEA